MMQPLGKVCIFGEALRLRVNLVGLLLVHVLLFVV